MKAERGSSRGMTLIETVMMIAVGSIVVGGIVHFTQTLTINENKMRDRLFALDLAQMQMESLMNTPYTSLADGSTDIVFYGFKVRQTVALDRTLTQTQGSVSLTFSVKKITMTADYGSGDFTKPLLQIVTYRQSNVLMDAT